MVAVFKVYFNLHGQMFSAKDSTACINL